MDQFSKNSSEYRVFILLIRVVDESKYITFRKPGIWIKTPVPWEHFTTKFSEMFLDVCEKESNSRDNIKT